MEETIAQRIRKKRIKEVVIEDFDGSKETFKLRGIPAQTVLDNYSLFDSVDSEKVDVDTKNLSAEDKSYIEKKIAPIMRVCLPDCCISPRIVIDEDDPLIDSGVAMSIKDLSVEQMVGLFEHVFELAGFSKKTIEERKKKQSPTSVK